MTLEYFTVIGTQVDLVTVGENKEEQWDIFTKAILDSHWPDDETNALELPKPKYLEKV